MSKKITEILKELKKALENNEDATIENIQIINLNKAEIEQDLDITRRIREHLSDDVERHLQNAINEPVLRSVLHSYMMATLCVLFKKGKIILKKRESPDEKKIN